jgi:hypothetical protein
MKDTLHIKDKFEGEQDELGHKLFEAFEDLRPEAGEFRKGVQDRIDAASLEGSSGSAGKIHSLRNVPSFVSRAAAFVPPVLLPKSIAKIGLGAPAAFKTGASVVPGVVLLPVLSIIMICFTLVLGLRTVHKGSSGLHRQDEIDAQDETRAWWRRFWIPVFLMVLASFSLIPRVPGDALTIMITISTVAFLGVYASLSRGGLATRREVGTRAATAMGFLVCGSIPLAVFPRTYEFTFYGGWLVPIALAVGHAVCLHLSKVGGERMTGAFGRPGRWPRRPLLSGAWTIFVLLIIQTTPVSGVEGTPESVRARLSTYEDTDDIKDLDQTMTNFIAAGEDPFDLQTLGRAARIQLDRELERGDFNSHNGSAFARLGFLEDPDYRHFVNQMEIDEALSSKPIKPYRLNSLMPAILGHLRFGSFTLEERNLIADNAIAGLEPDRPYSNANAKNLKPIVHLLDMLDLPERLDELAPAVEQLLQASWCRTVNGEKAAFSSSPNSIDRDENGDSAETRLGFSWGHTTSISVWLMSRFGVPAWMTAGDLQALDTYLSYESYYFVIFSGLDPHEAEATSARTLLHTTKAWANTQPRPRSLPHTLFRLRAVIAAVLLAAFSVFLTKRAPEELPAA